MTSPRPVLREGHVRQFVDERCLPPGPGRVGAELEWFVEGDLDHDTVAAAAGSAPFPAGSLLTFEPGGQVELSGPPGIGPTAAWTALRTDAAELARRLEGVGTGLLGAGVHPDREPVRVLRLPRYDAMAAYWRTCGEHDRGAGLAMMCNTASVQVSVDASLTGAPAGTDPGDRDQRWRLAHALSPVLGAAFANSPMALGQLTGWRSTRLGIWEGLDRTRTAPALRTGRAVDDWAAYVLDASVMLIRSGSAFRPLRAPFPFGRWLAEGHELGWPDEDDLAYHVSTLFPPVRARGWLELRVVDAVPEPWWPVAVAVTAALLDDPEAADGAARATGRASWCWCEAPRWALSYEPLAEAARRCFALASAALPRLGASDELVALVDAYRDRFVERGHCPADETLEAVGAAT
jgi:glutamate--cysteine ligase